jgi:hypothetical protein
MPLFGGDTVRFYSITTEDTAWLACALTQFEASLPPSVEVLQ